MKRKKEIIIGIVCILIVVISVSFAWFSIDLQGEDKALTVNSTSLKITFDNGSSAITASDISPGWSTSSDFSIKSTSDVDYSYDIILKNYINTFTLTKYLQYKITSDNGEYNMTEYEELPSSVLSGDFILAYNITITPGSTQNYTLHLRYVNDENVNQSDDMAKTLSGNIFITDGTVDRYNGYQEGTLAWKILDDNPMVVLRNDFNSTFTYNTTHTIYKTTEKNVHNTSDTTVYYYAGNTTNNWVKFGKDSYGNDFYWRIIRTNADGSVRLLYSGKSPDTTAGYIGSSKFNDVTMETTDPMYVGYMYGTSGSLESNRTNTNDSTIKTYIDNWYANNMTAYTSYLSTTAVYCNDRNLASGSTYSTSSEFYYAADERLARNKTPSYNCTTAEDAFSVDNTSAKLTYPIGLMTADEVSYAGGVVYTSLSSPYVWYYSNSAGGSSTGSEWWWLVSAYDWYYVSSSSGNAYVFCVYGSNDPGRLSDGYVLNSVGVRPTVSVKSETMISGGAGTSDNPYIID